MWEPRAKRRSFTYNRRVVFAHEQKGPRTRGNAKRIQIMRVYIVHIVNNARMIHRKKKTIVLRKMPPRIE